MMERIDYTIHAQGGDPDRNPIVMLTGRDAHRVKAAIRNETKLHDILGFHRRIGVTVHATDDLPNRQVSSAAVG